MPREDARLINQADWKRAYVANTAVPFVCRLWERMSRFKSNKKTG